MPSTIGGNFAIDYDVVDSRGILARLLVGANFGDCLRIKNDEIGKGAVSQLIWPLRALFNYLRHSGAAVGRARNPGANV